MTNANKTGANKVTILCRKCSTFVISRYVYSQCAETIFIIIYEKIS